MKKHIRKLVKLLILIIAVILLYFIGVLAINTAYDYRPEEGRFEVNEFGNKDAIRADDTLSIVSWNIGYAGLGSESDFFYDGGSMARPAKEDFNRYQNGILNKLTTFDTADILLLQEVDIRSSRSYQYNQFQLIDKVLPSHSGYFVKNYDVFYVPMPVFSPMGRVESGISFFSKKRLIESNWKAFDGNRSWPLGLFMPDRCYSVSIFETASSALLYVFNTHNSAFDDGSLRNSQLDQLYAEMIVAYNAGHYVIAGGDWNLNPTGYENHGFLSRDISFSIDNIQEVGGPAELWQVIYDPGYPTNREVSSSYMPGNTPTTILDYFVCSPNIHVLGINTQYDGFAYSDHHPVLMRFILD